MIACGVLVALLLSGCSGSPERSTAGDVAISATTVTPTDTVAPTTTEMDAPTTAMDTSSSTADEAGGCGAACTLGSEFPDLLETLGIDGIAHLIEKFGMTAARWMLKGLSIFKR
jgi:hypothetical protein